MPRICITVADKTPQPYRFPLDTEVVTLGRGKGNDVVIDHSSISGSHCEMKRVEGGFILEDTNSTNGIFRDKEEMKIIDLIEEQSVRIGDVEFEYTLTDEEKSELAEEDFSPQEKTKKKRKTNSNKSAKSSSSPQLVSSQDSGPSYSPASSLSPRQDNGARDFGIFCGFAILALLAFYFGLNSAHKSFLRDEIKNLKGEERRAAKAEIVERSLLKDMLNKDS